jgi:hypothetical protein
MDFKVPPRQRRQAMAKILLVDDDLCLLRLCKDELSEERYTVILAKDGKEALTKFDSGVRISESERLNRKFQKNPKQSCEQLFPINGLGKTKDSPFPEEVFIISILWPRHWLREGKE